MAEPLWSHAAAGLAIRRLPPAEMHVLRVRSADRNEPPALATRLGLPLDHEPNKARGTDPRVFWTSVDEWLIVGSAPDAAAVADAAEGRTVHLASVGKGRVRYALEGPNVRELLAKGCPLDLHPTMFQADDCAQTVLGPVPVLIDRLDAGKAFHINLDASYAGWMQDWLIDACIEFDHAAASPRIRA